METIPKEVFMKKAREQGYKEGLVMGELKAMVRIKKGVKKYIKEHKELKQYKDDLLNIILGVKL
jgi:hypothetical protein